MEANKVTSIASDTLAVAAPIGETIATVLGHPEIALILGLVHKYGPTLADDLVSLWEKKDVTIADVRVVLGRLKRWEEYGIPD